MTVYQWLCVVGIPSIITLLLSRIITRRLDKSEEKAEEARRMAEESEERNAAIANGIQALLRDRLLQGYKTYQEAGYAGYQDRENMENIYAQYHALGGNGAMTDMRRAFRTLPMTPGGQPTVIDD